MGAWIEMLVPDVAFETIESLPLWERGLKLRDLIRVHCLSSSLPLWERGLKSSGNIKDDKVKWSLPLWERGLKLLCKNVYLIVICRSPCGSVD